MLFIHGLGCAGSSDFPAVAADPALAGRRRLLVDLLGSGFSDRPGDFAYTMAAHAEVLLQWLDGLGIGEVDLFGHSMGGAVAIELAGRLGPRVRHVLLAEPNLDAGGGFVSRQIAGHSEAEYLAHGHDAMLRAARLQGAHAWAGSLAQCLPAALHRQSCALMAGGTPSWRSQLLALTVPRTLIVGAQSLPDADSESLALAGLPVRVLGDAGHAMACDNPAGLAQLIAEVLA
ncbi:alpha/beta fold hydrolase [Chitinimonas sp.]|uniref:alpha/beta fold hydrolase n=1 Tax=Chitinimonas sp. TaxID=1934313 RepID=UPI0035AE153E